MKTFLSSLIQLVVICVLSSSCNQQHLQSTEQDKTAIASEQREIITRADQTDEYLPYLKGKRVGMVVNPTSVIGTTPSVDSLKALGVNIVKIFGPEHGFSGDASAGVKVYCPYFL
jgi:uncharacterized protein YbbC (DUF1343 family)